MPSPLSNAEKLAESNRQDDIRRDKERDDVFKSYHDRDPRLALPPQRKGKYMDGCYFSKLYPRRSRITSCYLSEVQRKPFSDMFEQDSQLIHPEPKLPSLDTVALNAKWKAVQAAR